MKKNPRRPCQACHEDEATHGVEQWPEEFYNYCEACGKAMVTVIWDAHKRVAAIVELAPLPPVVETELPPAKTKNPTIDLAPVVVTPKKRGRPPKVRPVVETPLLAPPTPATTIAPDKTPPAIPKEPEGEGETTMDDLLGM